MVHLTWRKAAISAAISATIFIVTNSQAATYKIENVPVLDLNYSSPEIKSIDINGNAVGTANYQWDNGTTGVLRDTSGLMTNLTPDGDALFYGEAHSINSSGQILTTSNNNVYLVQNGVRTLIQTGLFVPFAFGLNDQGQFVGHYTATVNGVKQQHAFLYSNGVVTDLGTLPSGGGSTARGINNSGHIVGSASNSSGLTHAVMWRDGAIVDLGVLPGDTTSRALAINDNDQIIGTSFGPNGTRGFIWQNGVMSDMGAYENNPYIAPSAINNAGVVVGVTRGSFFSFNGRGESFMWVNGKYKNLNPLVAHHSYYGCGVTAISNAGHIGGNCIGTDLTTFMLTPTQDGVDVGMEIYATPMTNARQGDPLVYTIRVGNVGSLDATGVTVNDVLPAGADFQSVTTTQGNCTGGATVTCSLGTLAAGAEAIVTLTVIPNKTGGLTNAATVSLNEVDVNPENNATETGSLIIAPAIFADVGITMTASPAKIRRGQFASYTMTVTNYGPNAADRVFLADDIPGFYSIKTTQGTCGGPDYLNQSRVSCSLGTIAVGATVTVTLTIRPFYTGTYTNSATVSTTPTIDNNTANNNAKASVTVVR